MRESVTDSILGTVSDLNRSGVVDDVTKRNIENLCIPDVKEYGAKNIVTIRRKYHLSQAALATLINVSVSTVQKWERGAKKPAGPSSKLLDLIERKGIEALV